MDLKRTVATEQGPVRPRWPLIEVGHFSTLDADVRPPARQEVLPARRLFREFVEGHRIKVRHHRDEFLGDVEESTHLIE